VPAHGVLASAMICEQPDTLVALYVCVVCVCESVYVYAGVCEQVTLRANIFIIIITTIIIIITIITSAVLTEQVNNDYTQ
jgi:hypothetical protein